MAEWVSMVVIVTIFPCIMIVCGRHYKVNAPKTISHFVGYRTERSMKNKDTWDFAHNYIGELMFKIGLVLLPVSVLPVIFAKGRIGEIGTLSAIISMVQIIPLLISIALTEKALKDNFDEEGNRKNGKSEE